MSENPNPAPVLADVSVRLTDNPSEGAAILGDSSLAELPSQYRCCSCLRADIPEHSLNLVTLAREGELYRVCRLCYLIAEVKELATGGGVSPLLLAHVDEELSSLYGLLRAEVDGA